MSSTEFGSATGGGASTQAGGSVSSSVKEKASTAMDTVARDAVAMASNAQDKAAQALEQQKRAVGGTIGDFASAIRKAGDQLSESDQSMGARVVRQAADGLEHLSRSLADKGPNEILDAARDFGRRNPVAFAAGAVLLGVALGRLARSTGSDSSASNSSTSSQSAGLTAMSSSGGAWRSGTGPAAGGNSRQGAAPAYGEEGFNASGDYATPGGSAPQEEMVLTDTAADPLDPSVGVPR